MNKIKLAAASVFSSVAALAYAGICKAAEVTTSTQEALTTGITDGRSSLDTFLGNNASNIILGVVTISLLYLGIRLIRKIFGGR